MSMICRFVQVSPATLAQLRRDPSDVAALFFGSEAGEGPAPGGIPTERLAAQRSTMLPRLQAMMKSSLGAMPPAQREALQKHFESIGINDESVQTEAGAGKLLDSMIERGRQQMAQIGGVGGIGGTASRPRGVLANLTIDKAWHGVHYLLCGKADRDSDIGAQAVMGGDEIGDDDSGYGPARCFAPGFVAQIVAAFDRPGLDAEMRARFVPGEMTRLGIYPGGWDQQPGGLAWLTGEFDRLREFYRDAATNGLAMLTCLV
jgi:hypothetical protein